jgi:hypothetical protein
MRSLTSNLLKREGLPYRSNWTLAWRNNLTHPPPLLAFLPLMSGR